MYLEQARETLDILARDVLVAGTTVQFSGAAISRATVSAPVAVTDILRAVRTLQTNRAKKITSIVNPSANYNSSPINAAFVGIVGPGVLFNLRQLAGWIPVEQYAQKNDVMEGEVGALSEVRFILSENARIFTGQGAASADVHATLIFGANAYGMTRIAGEAMRNIIKPLGSAGSADPLDQRATSGWKATFVTRILNELAMLRLESTATA